MASSYSEASNRARRRIASIALNRPAETSHASRIAGRAVSRPLLHRRGERRVHRFLGQVEVAKNADQGGEYMPGLGAIDGLNPSDASARPRPLHQGRALGSCCRRFQIGLTSMLPTRAAGIFAAAWMASFRSLASMR